MFRLSWARAALALAIAGLFSVSAGAQATRWYDDYSAGVAAARRGDWAQAETLLLRARQANPKQGRSVYTYGDQYIEYVPDLWLAQAYANTKRADEAADAIGRLAGILPANDARLAAIQKLVAEVKAAAPAPVAQRGQGAPAQGSDPVPPSQVQSGASSPPAGVRPTLPGGVLPGSSPTYTGGISAPGGSRSSQPPVIPPRTPSQTFPTGPVNVAPSPSLRNGILAYFSGSYGSALPLLEAASRDPKDAPRARLFLAFAKVALVLTGGADAALLQEARADFETAGGGQASLDGYQSFISPRVLAELQSQ